ncbi:type II secretion system protein [Fervidobacterium sp. 2310opik-2]|uniref:type II secretion system protein n=1 Tax=Fervidobacterium sp. 2310opik-2 TaxID=1755815 RepID=UPI0013DF9118|nr:type II secretion system protein [Fervidobacterium sp. 2310opik-2]KAF2961218.1 N-terminal cleavage protein [Fervidobacterium sp. 2310opik-2]
MRKGFTLVELLIVLAVIAALMAVATPLALNAVKNAKASQVAQNFRNIKSAVENMFNTEKPTNPTASITMNELVNSKYLNSAPANFSVSAAAGAAGTYNVTITYSGNDVELKRVQDNGMGDVKQNGKDLELTFSVQKWW